MTTINENCTDCGRDGPSAHSMRTMTEEGWRLHKTADEGGRTHYSWLCPACWERRNGTAPLQGRRKRTP